MAGRCARCVRQENISQRLAWPSVWHAQEICHPLLREGVFVTLDIVLTNCSLRDSVVALILMNCSSFQVYTKMLPTTLRFYRFDRL